MIFTPFSVGKLDLPNRITMAAMVSNFAREDGSVTERLIDYHVNIAKGGCALNTTEASYVSAEGKRIKYGLGMHDDRLIPGLKELTQAVHSVGGKISAQIFHGGRECSSEITGFKPVAPSLRESQFRAITKKKEFPRVLTIEEIKGIVKKFGDAAERVREAGFDAIEIHGAHGYLISQFLSPYSNMREDDYGGDQENRCRFLIEILQEVKRKAGNDFPVILKLNIEDYVDGGITTSLAKVNVANAVNNGADAIIASAALHEARPYMQISAMYIEPYTNVPLAQEIKRDTTVPVGAVGRITEPWKANEIIEDGKADFVVLGRQLLADPEWPLKAREGRYDDIAECIACNQGCIDQTHAMKPMTCLRNPAVGREKSFAIEKAGHPKKVIVIGGGPAGLEVARVAAQRSHNVTLFEKSSDLGGQLKIAKNPPGRSNLEKLRVYLEKQAYKLGVSIHLNSEVTKETIDQLDADTLIIATGAKQIIPRINGVSKENVAYAWQVLSHDVEVGKRVVVVGGGLVGLEVSDFLQKENKRIILLEMRDSIFEGIGNATRIYYEDNVINEGVEVLLNAMVTHIDEDGVVYEKNGWRNKILGVDTVVVAVGSTKEDLLLDDLKGKHQCKIFRVGDCAEPRDLMEAIYDAGKVAREI